MKKLYLFIILLIITSFILNIIPNCYLFTPPVRFAEKDDDSDNDSNSYFFKSYGGSDFDQGLKIIKTSDNNVLLIGGTQSWGLGGDIIIVKMDLDGNIIWQKAYGSTNNDAGKDIVETNDGYVFCGYTDSYTVGGYDNLLIKIDFNGNIIWERVFGDTSDNSYCAMIKDDTDFLVASRNNNGAWLIKLDQNGNELWERDYDELTTFYSIIKDSDGNYILGGHGQIIDMEDFTITKTDNTGNVLWTRTVNTGINYYERAYSITIASDGGYVLTGSSGPFDDYNIFIAKYSSSGVEEWVYRYVNNDSEGTNIIKTTDNNFLIGGYTNSIGSGGEDMMLLKIASDGNSINWAKTYGGVNMDRICSLVEINSSKIMAIGLTESYGVGGRDLILLSINGTGGPMGVSFTPNSFPSTITTNTNALTVSTPICTFTASSFNVVNTTLTVTTIY